MHWVYILKLHDDKYYVGETTRLFRRMFEHLNGSGSKYTKEYVPDELIGIYKVKNHILYKYAGKQVPDIDEDNIKIDALELENEMTKFQMKICGNKWFNVRGGIYVQDYIKDNPSTNYNPTRPLCKCDLPAEVNVYNDKLYFRCVKKNFKMLDERDLCTEEHELSCDFSSDCCDFYLNISEINSKLDTDIELYQEYIDNDPDSSWILNVPSITRNGAEYRWKQDTPCIMCKRSSYNPIYALYRHRPICKICLCNKYDEIKSMYEDEYGFLSSSNDG